jgi:hypothetical protein
MMHRIRITSGEYKGRYIGGPFSGWGLITNPEARVNPPVNITGAPYALHATEHGATQFGSAQEFVETRILGRSLKNDEFGLGDRHALGLEQ